MKLTTVCLYVICCVLSCCLFCDGKSKAKSLSVLTFNTWLHESLIESYNGKESRKRRIIKSLKSSNTDVACLQEVYIGQDLEDIVNGVRKQFPHSFSELHQAVNKFPAQAKRSTRPPCNANLVNALGDCISSASGCNATAAEQNADCLYTNCLAPVLAIFQSESQECITCITFSLLNMDACSDKGSVVGGRQMNNGGLVLLSKKPLRKVSFTDFYPSTKESIIRGFLTAEIKGYARVMCAHLSPIIRDNFLEPEILQTGITSYPEMNTLETKAVIKRLKGVKRLIFMGSLNIGPSPSTENVPNLQKNYNQLRKQFRTKTAKEYTFKDPTDASRQSILDHIFVRSISIKKTKRVFVPQKDESPMSDHVGVRSLLMIKK